MSKIRRYPSYPLERKGYALNTFGISFRVSGYSWGDLGRVGSGYVRVRLGSDYLACLSPRALTPPLSRAGVSLGLDMGFGVGIIKLRGWV
eukprot:756611-Amorphochlora_amoeboformis.AAC.1